MPLRLLTADERLDVPRGTPVVAIPLYGAHSLFTRCLRSILAHTPQDVPVLIADDHGPEPASQRWVEELDTKGVLEHEVIWLRQPANLGFVGNCNAAFAASGQGDVVLVNSDVEVAASWLEGLRDAAYTDSSVATATALTNNGSIVSVPTRNVPVPGLPQHLTLDDAAARVRKASPRLHPRLLTAIGHCVYIRRQALDLADGFDDAFAPAYGEEVDFSQRCLVHGLQHVAADDVLVLHHGKASLGIGGERNPIQDEHELLLESRYPAYHPGILAEETDACSPLARTLRIAGVALLGPSVTIDGRSLGGAYTGTQLHTLELVRALHRTGAARLRVLMPPTPGPHAARTLATLAAEGVQLIAEDDVDEGVERHDVVHRPYQVDQAGQLETLRLLGDRLVLTQQDLIAYRNPGYFPSAAAWLAYKDLTKETLALADRVAFFTPHAAADAQAEALLHAGRSAVVLLGADHQGPDTGQVRPPGLPDGEEPFLLVLGTDFRHKHRVFALKLLAALRERHGWEGRLVLAGAQVAHGSSAGDEAAWLSLHPEHAAAVTRLPAISEEEKHWLLARTAAVVYPTTYEGFGLMPFEAAAAGTPCFFAHVTSLADTLGDCTAVLEPWDASVSADRAIGVLRDPATAQRLVDEVRAAAEQLTWDRTGARLLEVYDEVLRSPARDLARTQGDRHVLDARYWTLRHQIGDTGLALVGPDSRLLPDEAQRTLAALAQRPATRVAMLGALRAVRKVTARAVNGAGAGGRGASGPTSTPGSPDELA